MKWRSRQWTLGIPYRADLPTIDETKKQLARWQRAEQGANDSGNAENARRDCRRRWSACSGN